MQLGSMFICNCNIALHVSDAFCFHLQDGIHTSVDAIDLGSLVGYLNPSHVTHQRLLLQFLSAPEDGSKKLPKHVELYCSYK